MTPGLKEKVGARNRLQRQHGREMHANALERRLINRHIAEGKIKRSRQKLRGQIAASKQMALRARQKAVEVGEYAKKRARANRTARRGG
jgi:hypothetical protein